jgi:hypothetical protein
MKIDVRILCAADPEAEVRSLHDWLRSEHDLHQSRVELTSPRIRDGEMGAGLEVVTVALGSGGAITVLANSLSVWLRNRGTDLTFEISGPTGKIVIDARRARDPKELIETIVAAAGDEQ